MKILFGISILAALCWPASQLAAQGCTGGQGGMYAQPSPGYGGYGMPSYGGYSVPRQTGYTSLQLGLQHYRMPQPEGYYPPPATAFQGGSPYAYPQGGGYSAPCPQGGYYAYPGGGSQYAYPGGGYPPPAVMGYPENYAPVSYGTPSGYCPTCGSYHR